MTLYNQLKMCNPDTKVKIIENNKVSFVGYAKDIPYYLDQVIVTYVEINNDTLIVEVVEL